MTDVVTGVDVAGMGRTLLAVHRSRRSVRRSLDIVVDVAPAASPG